MKDLKTAIDRAIFADDAHRARYEELRGRVLIDPTKYNDHYREALSYLLALNIDCYDNVHDLYNFKEHSIIPEGISEEWQTGTSKKTTRLAFNLYSSSCLWCEEGTEHYCAVDEIFNCDYAPYFVEAVKIWGYTVF